MYRNWENVLLVWKKNIHGRSNMKSSGCAGTEGPRGAIPHWRSGRAAVRRYPSSKVRSSGCALLGISKLKWTGMSEFNSDDHYIYYCGQESLRRNGVAIMVSKRVWNAVFGCNLKNDRMISFCFQDKPFNITVNQAYARPVTLKKLKLNGSMKTYKTF